MLAENSGYDSENEFLEIPIEQKSDAYYMLQIVYGNEKAEILTGLCEGDSERARRKYIADSTIRDIMRERSVTSDPRYPIRTTNINYIK